jgi:hypothetical protein
MPSTFTPTEALEHLRGRLDHCGDECAESLRALLGLISPSRPDSVESLTHIILDGGIWPLMKETVNLVAYNPQGTPIDSPESAVANVGLDRVSRLALSLMVERCFRLQVSAAAQRDAAALALASGLLVRELARRQAPGDSELGMVCAILRNYSRLMLAGILREDAAEARSLAVALDEDERYVAIFGLAPLELSQHLFIAGRLPRVLSRCLSECPSYLITAAPFTYEDEIIRLTDFAFKVTALSVDPKADQEKLSLQIDRVRELLDLPPSLRGWDVETMLVAVLQQLTDWWKPGGEAERDSVVIDGLRAVCHRAVA